MIRPGIGDGRNKLHHIDITQPGARDVGRAGITFGGGHAGYLHAADHAAIIKQILLHHLHGLVADEPAKIAHTHFPSARGNGDGERIGHGFPVFVPVGGNGLFKQVNFVGFQYFANSDSLFGIVASVAIGIEGDVATEGFPHQGDELFGAPGRHFRVAAAAPDFKFHGLGPCFCLPAFIFSRLSSADLPRLLLAW